MNTDIRQSNTSDNYRKMNVYFFPRYYRTYVCFTFSQHFSLSWKLFATATGSQFRPVTNSLFFFFYKSYRRTKFLNANDVQFGFYPRQSGERRSDDLS